MKVKIGKDFETYGTLELTSEGIEIVDGNMSIMTAIVMDMKRDEMSNEEFIKSLPSRLNGRMWAEAIDFDPIDFEDVIEKFNPYHDEIGRFTTAVGVGASSGLQITRNSPFERKDLLIRGTTVAPFQLGVIKHATGEVSIIATSDAISLSDDDLESALDAIDRTLVEIDPSHLEDLDSIALIRAFSWGGRYTPGQVLSPDNQIQLNVARLRITDSIPRRALDRDEMDYVFKHEIGHHVWWNYLDGPQRERFSDLSGFPSPKVGADLSPENIGISIRYVRVKDITRYGSSNLLEAWAESYTLIDWNDRTNRNSPLGTLSQGTNPSRTQFDDVDAVLEEISEW